MKPAAFQATFADFKLIKGRKVAQIILEVTVEAADAALETLGGVPRPDKEAWVAVARIDLLKAVSEPPKPSIDDPKPRRKFSSLPYPTQAALRCNDPSFAKFLAERLGGSHTDINAADVVRLHCGVASRSELAQEGKPAMRWYKLNADYETWLAEPGVIG